MNYKILTLLILPAIFFTGCSSLGDSVPSSSFVDRTMTDYSFMDVSDSCEIFHNIDLENSSDLCSIDKKPYTMFYTEENNWSLMCCEYKNKCVEDNNENLSQICLDITDKYSGYVFNDAGFWMSQCCDENGGNCYVDLSIDVEDDSTICDQEFQKNTYSINFNNTQWESMCCIGGLLE